MLIKTNSVNTPPPETKDLDWLKGVNKTQCPEIPVPRKIQIGSAIIVPS